ncbi:putative pectinesterase/pectinesterase inhibitor 61 [Capsicum annuum]|nr:putative pectinesterase/pectinesterase inhibitor 61 [Capsicum annuum]
MGYGRLGKPDPGETSGRVMIPNPNPKPRCSKIKFLVSFATVLLLAAAISVAVLVGVKHKAGNRIDKPSQAMAHTCSRTLYPSLCLNSLINFPGANSASDNDLVHISVNLTLQRFDKALYVASDINNLQMNTQTRSAYDDCLELLEESIDLLSQSLTSVFPGDSNSPTGSTNDVMTWLSAALTNQDTCTDGFADVTGNVKDHMSENLKDLSELVSNALAIYAAANGDDDFSGIPIQNRRRRLMHFEKYHDEFPKWMSRRDRKLMNKSVSAIQADIIVAKDGTGTVKTIAEAIKKVPEKSNKRTIIYVKAGRYEENNLKVGRKKMNVMFIGDGKGKTVITGGKTATGAGFIARDMTFENYAGPNDHQAVALRIGGDHAVVFRCNIIGYQDTLYVHSQRQFYRECDIYGTVDFIFGNAAVVIQNCNIYARKPMANQKNTITAQNRKDPNQNTGISIHACKILATSDLEASKGSFPTYLGRPWKMYSRTVYMLSNMGDHIHPQGWLEWNGNFALNTLYYGEYMNFGPGAALGKRVTWPGYRVIKSVEEASKFTVSKFIYGSSWLPSTGVSFLAGLST